MKNFIGELTELNRQIYELQHKKRLVARAILEEVSTDILLAYVDKIIRFNFAGVTMEDVRRELKNRG